MSLEETPKLFVRTFLIHDESIPCGERHVERFGMKLDTPEFVVVGMQSDGKSSFIEALLGFQFNIINSTIGTRRPLIIQMKSDINAKEPICCFKKENELEFEPPIKVEELTNEIIKRTNDKCGIGDNVSKEPIVLRVNYINSSNLTIIDTPGFRIGGDDKIKNDIKNMVKDLIKDQSRMIICLEQSTVEWANTVSRPFVVDFDQNLERTILIQTKFDNRVKEFNNGEMANKYLDGEGITEKKRPYFISLPIKRTTNKEEYLKMVKERYLDDYKSLLNVGFNEDKYMERIGFFKVRKHLEKELMKKYSIQLKPTIDFLKNELIKTEQEINSYEKELSRTADLNSIKIRVMNYLGIFNSTIEKLISGECGVEPKLFGESLEEEKSNSGIENWPDFDYGFEIDNSNLKLFGGAQYERLLKEIEFVFYSREIPLPSIDEVCVTLGMKEIGNGYSGIDRAASGIIKSKSAIVIEPVINIALKRIEYVFDRL